MNRVVITGQGIVSSLGIGAKENCEALQNGKCGIDLLDISGIEKLNIKIGAAVKGYQDDDYFTKQEILFFDKFTQFAIIAAKEAMIQSGIEINGELEQKTGVILGNAGGGLQTQDENFKSVYALNKSRLHPFIIPKLMSSAATSQISIMFNAKGPSFTLSTACASSNHAMGQAYKMIQSGSLIAAITGGAESMLCFGGLKAWEGLRVMSNDNCRPFCANRTGMVQGEGAGIFVFEEYTHARARGAKILAEIIGFEMNSDASDIVKPNKIGAVKAISGALADAKVDPIDVGYINAHGTGTLINDKIETAAIKTVFQDHSKQLLVSSTKSMHGHLIGGAGAVELFASVMAVREGIIPPTINYTSFDPDCDLDFVTNVSRESNVDIVVSNAFAFGGCNAVIVLKRF